jgi:Mg-chelatase subunit ChlD
MVSWATKRQLAYLFFPMLLMALLAGFIYTKYMYIAPTCFDGRQNGTETGVDCGGSCTRVCTIDTLDPVVLWSKAFKVTPTVVNAVAYIENPNVYSEVKQAQYTLTLYDANHKQIAQRTGVTSIPNNTRFAVFEGGIQTGGQTVVYTDFSFTKPFDWVKNDKKDLYIVTEYSPLQREATSPYIEGTVKAPDVVKPTTIELVAIIYDGKQNAIGTSRTVNTLSADHTSDPFVFTWPQPFEVKTDVCAVPSDIMLVLDRSGSMASISKNPTEPLETVKKTASAFVDALHEEDRVGVVSFATTASDPVDAGLTSSLSTVKQTIGAISIATSSVQNTNIGDGLKKAYDELISHTSTSQKVIILLTDGDPTDPQVKGQKEYPFTYARSIASTITGSNIMLYTIGLGKEVNANFLTELAGSKDRFFSAPTKDELSSIYNRIGTSLCVRKPNVIEIISRVIER